MSTDAFRGPLASAFAAARAVPTADLLRPPDDALPLAPATSRETWDARTGVVHRATAEPLIGRAHADRGTPWPHPLASTAARVHRDGDRDAHERLVFDRQHRLSRAVLASAVTLDDTAVDEAADGLWQLCEQSSWCWPAHDHALQRHGSVLTVVTDPDLDLGAGEVAAHVAWADHLLGPLLDARYPGLRARLRHEVRRRVLDPFVTRRDWHWIGLGGSVHNWNPWIHGNVLVAALRLLDAPGEAAERAHVVDLCVEGIDRYVAALPVDGAIDEGVGYWWNGACRALEALDVLRHATGGALDALASDVVPPALRETVAFPHRMHLGGDWHLSFADAQARPTDTRPWHALHRAARAVGDDDAAAYAASRLGPDDLRAEPEAGLGRLLRGITDNVWCDAVRPDAVRPGAADRRANAPLPRRSWWASTQVLVVRERPGTPAGLTLAVKGGHNGEAHNHNDVGSVVVASDGVPVVVDAGRPTYTARTFGPDRYDLWMMQSSWHSVPQVAGVAQGVGAAFAARDVTPSGDGLALDLAGAYPVPGLRSWRRDARLEAVDDGARVVVDDAWSLDASLDESSGAGPDAGPTTVRFLLAGEVEIRPGRAVVQPLDGATPVTLTWPADVPASLVEQPLDDPMLGHVWGERLTRLDLDADGRDALRVTITTA
jgi:hypothetical protein